MENTEVQESLKQLEQMKEDLLSLATHRLRGPLTSIRGYTSLMAESDNIPSNVKEIAKRILESTNKIGGETFQEKSGNY